MICYVIIPVYNEEKTLGQTLESLVNQSRVPDRILLVNDGSTDSTAMIIDDFSNKYDFIDCIHLHTESKHLPGEKVVNAFNKGLEQLDENYDLICKFDADLIFPKNYFEKLIEVFLQHPKIGIAGGLLFIKNQNKWIFENIASKEHVRGPIKAYRKSCFKEIGELRPAIGWDTIDTLLAQYYKWETTTIEDLHVKHLKPTGASYTKASKLLLGERWYNMRYGLLLTFIASLKDSIRRSNIKILFYSINGYMVAKRSGKTPVVTQDQGRFIRRLRWQAIRKKFI